MAPIISVPMTGKGDRRSSYVVAVDSNEDAKASKFKDVQPLSTCFSQLLETECVENRRFLEGVEICLGHRGSHS